MKLTATTVVLIGALICLTGTFLLARLDLSPEQQNFLRALVAVILGLFFMQVGYAQCLRDKLVREMAKHRPPVDVRE
jgi:hypothetical protein